MMDETIILPASSGDAERISFNQILPARKNWLLMGVLTLWLGLWAAGLMVVVSAILRGQIKEVGFFVVFFLLAWLTGWMLGGGIALYGLFWMGVGKETMVATPGALTLTQSIFGYQRIRCYEAAKIRNLRVIEKDQGMTDFLLSLRLFGIGNGQLTFDCGTTVVTFAEGLNRAQAEGVLAEIRAALFPHQGNASV